METKSGKLRIETTIWQNGGNGSDSMLVEADAIVRQKEDDIYILYEQKDEETGEVMSNMIHVHDKDVDIIGKGQTERKMELRLGKTTKSDYKTPYGTLPLEVATTYLRVLLTNHRLDVETEYNISMQGDRLSRNKVKIIVKM